jgi:hypothetical protein
MANRKSRATAPDVYVRLARVHERRIRLRVSREARRRKPRNGANPLPGFQWIIAEACEVFS